MRFYNDIKTQTPDIPEARIFTCIVLYCLVLSCTGVDHTDDILSVAMHPLNGKIVATGQVGRKPKVYVWDIDTMESGITHNTIHITTIAVQYQYNSSTIY